MSARYADRERRANNTNITCNTVNSEQRYVSSGLVVYSDVTVGFGNIEIDQKSVRLLAPIRGT